MLMGIFWEKKHETIRIVWIVLFVFQLYEVATRIYMRKSQDIFFLVQLSCEWKYYFSDAFELMSLQLQIFLYQS